MPDGGLTYCETDLSRAIAEPWTTATELAFLALALVWAWRLRGRYREHLYVSLTLPVIFVGFVGGVLYHALRSHRAYFLMDVIPILILAVGTLSYLAWRVWRRTWVALLYPVVLVGLIFGILQVSENVTAFAFIYSLIALAIAGPVVVDLRRLPRGRRDAKRKLRQAVAAVVIGTIIHHQDHAWCDVLPMGTLWFWHLCAAFAAHRFFGYLVTHPVRA